MGDAPIAGAAEHERVKEPYYRVTSIWNNRPAFPLDSDLHRLWAWGDAIHGLIDRIVMGAQTPLTDQNVEGLPLIDQDVEGLPPLTAHDVEGDFIHFRPDWLAEGALHRTKDERLYQTILQRQPIVESRWEEARQRKTETAMAEYLDSLDSLQAAIGFVVCMPPDAIATSSHAEDVTVSAPPNTEPSPSAADSELDWHEPGIFYFRGDRHELTPLPHRVLVHLVESKQEVFTSAQLAQMLDRSIGDDAIRGHVYKIRKALRAAAEKAGIECEDPVPSKAGVWRLELPKAHFSRKPQLRLENRT